MNQKALLTDQYELTMAASYFQHRMFADATFSLFIREYPANRAYFVSAGLEEVNIFASGGFDEFKIDRLLKKDAKIDAFGVGTKMGTSADAPYTDMAYKLVEYDGRPVLKLSSGKKTLVGQKQAYRLYEKGKIHHDLITLRREDSGGEPLETDNEERKTLTGPGIPGNH
jgi:nicotinic acid phosphoribosyltransferase